MRSDSAEPGGRKRGQAMVRWVSVERAARMLDVSASWVRRFEAAGGFGAGNSAVLKLPGRAVGELRIRACAMNRAIEGMAQRREMDRQVMVARFNESREEVVNG